MPRCASRAGFTLVEVLVATSIIAIGLLGALTAFSMASRVTAASTYDTIVSALAQQRLAEVRALALSDLLPEGESEGDFGDEHPGCSWRIVVGRPDEMHVRRVDVIISAPRSGKTHETRFTTSLF